MRHVLFLDVFISLLHHLVRFLLLLVQEVDLAECVLGIELSCDLREAVDLDIVNVFVLIVALHSALGVGSSRKMTGVEHVLERPIFRLLESAVDVVQVSLS